jgi:acyl carrier protein
LNRFLTSVAEVLEVDEVGLETVFRETEGWCSLKAFGLLVMLENDYSAPVSIEKFLKLFTVRDLFREAALALAAEVFSVPRETLGDAAVRAEIPQWDSVNHLRLTMEFEKRFGGAFALEEIPALSSIDDFIREC